MSARGVALEIMAWFFAHEGQRLAEPSGEMDEAQEETFAELVTLIEQRDREREAVLQETLADYFRRQELMVEEADRLRAEVEERSETARLADKFAVGCLAERDKARAEVEMLQEKLSIIVNNAEIIPDPAMNGSTDIYTVPLDDINEARAEIEALRHTPEDHDPEGKYVALRTEALQERWPLNSVGPVDAAKEWVIGYDGRRSRGVKIGEYEKVADAFARAIIAAGRGSDDIER